MIVYVERVAPGGAIKGVYANRQTGYATEAIDDADAAVAAFINGRVPRDVRLILADFVALSGTQLTNCWNYITGGSPPRWRQSNSELVWAKASQATASNFEKQVGMAFLCREFPNLFNPLPTDATVNIPGDRAGP